MTPQATAGTGESEAPLETRLGRTQEARWMNPSTGTFLSVDPIVANAWDPQAFNAYAYARNNPVSFNDPTGTTFEPSGGGSIAGGGLHWVTQLDAAQYGALAVVAHHFRGGEAHIVWGLTQHISGGATGLETGVAPQIQPPADEQLEAQGVEYASLVGVDPDALIPFPGVKTGTGPILLPGGLVGSSAARVLVRGPQAAQLQRIFSNAKNFLAWIKGNHSLSRILHPLSHAEARVLINVARRLGLKVDTNLKGLQGLEKTGRWAGIPHFKIGNVHIPVLPGFVP